MNKYSKEDLEFLVKNYGKITAITIAKYLNRSHAEIRRKANELGLRSTLNNIGVSRYIHNKEYFKKLSVNNCYWAGFLAADGSIDSNKNILTVSLKSTDKKHLELLKKELGFTGTLKTVITTLKDKKYEATKLYICGAQTLIGDLKNNFNITQNKSLFLNPPNIENSEMAKAFIVGYIDGDGTVCFGKTKQKKRYLRLSVLGTKQFLNWINEFLNESYAIGTKNINKHKNIYAYQISSLMARRVLLDLCKIKVPKLKRKWNKVNSLC